MSTRKNISAKIGVFLLTSLITLSPALPLCNFTNVATNTLSPSSFFSENFFTFSLHEQAFLNNGKWFLKEPSLDKEAIIYEIIRDSKGNIIKTNEIFNSFKNNNRVAYDGKTDKVLFLDESGHNVLSAEDAQGKTREFKAYTHNMSPRYDQWSAVLIEKNHMYPPFDSFKQTITGYITKFPPKTALPIGNQLIQPKNLKKLVSKNFNTLDIKDLCLLYDILVEYATDETAFDAEISPYGRYKNIKKLEARLANQRHIKQQMFISEKTQNIPEESAFSIWLNAIQHASVRNMPNQLSEKRENLHGTYEINFTDKIQTIDPYTKDYQNFKMALVNKLSNNISTYGGSMHKQVREKFLSTYNLPAYHQLYPNTKRNASEIDNILGISTIHGRGRYSNTMTDNPNSWIESLTYLFKEQNYPWQDKINEPLKEVFPEFSAISVFDIKKNEHDKTICFPFASVAEILAYWGQKNTTAPKQLPEYITNPKAWVNHWKHNAERKKLVAMHLSYIEKIIKETNLISLSDPNLKGKYKSLDHLFSYTNFSDQIYIIKKYIHEHLPNFKEPKDLIEDIHRRIGLPKEDIVLADMVFLDPGLYNDKIGMPQYISPSIIFMLSDPEVFNKDKQNKVENPAEVSASYLKDIGINAKTITLNHADNTPFISSKHKENRKMQDIETTIMMLVTTLSLDSVSYEEKMELISNFNAICETSEPLYKSTSELKDRLSSNRCYKFVPKQLIPLFKTLTKKEEDTKRLLDILNYVRLNGLEQKFARITASIQNKDVFLYLFRNGNLKSMLKTDINEQFLSIKKQVASKDPKRTRRVLDANAEELITVTTATGDKIKIKEEATISNINTTNMEESDFVTNTKIDILEALTILKKQKIDENLSRLLTENTVNIKLFSPTESMLSNYFEHGKNNLYFLSEDKKSIYIDAGFLAYMAKDNLTKTNAIACVLAESLAQYPLLDNTDKTQISIEAKNMQQQILPGTTIKNIIGTYFSRLLAENNSYLQRQKEQYQDKNPTDFNFFKSMRHSIRENLREIMSNKTTYTSNLKDKVTLLKQLGQFAVFQPGNDLSAQHDFLASFFELSSLENLIKTLDSIEKNQKVSPTQMQVLRIFLKEMGSVEKYIGHLQKTKKEILLNYGTDVSIDKAYKHRGDIVYEVSINQKDVTKSINIEDLVSFLSKMGGEKFNFAGFNKGYCTWTNNGWKTFTPNRIIIKGTQIEPNNLNNVLQQISDLNKTTVSTLLANSNNIYNITPDRHMRSKIYSSNIAACKTKDELITETLRFILCSPDTTINIHSNLLYILKKSLRHLFIQGRYSNHPNKELIIETWQEMVSILKKHKKTPNSSILEHFSQKDFLGKGLLTFFRDFKKAELHRHITGSISPDLLLELFWLHPKSRREFLYKFAGFEKQKIEQTSSDEVDELFINYTKANMLKDKKSRSDIKELILLKNKLKEKAIEAVRNNNFKEKQVIDIQIKRTAEQIENLYGGEEAKKAIGQFIEYRPTEKIGVSIMEYLDKLEIAKLFLSYEDSLDIMRKYAFESVYEDYTFDNITLTELRTSGVRPGSPYTLEETVKAYVDGLLDAEDLSGRELSTGYILCLNKDLQNEIKPENKAPVKERVLSPEFQNTSLKDLMHETMEKAKQEINNDFSDISEQERANMMEEEFQGFIRMIEDTLLQLSFGRGENFDQISEKFNFRPSSTDLISEEDKKVLKKTVSLFEKLSYVKESSLNNLISRIEKLESSEYILRSIKTKIVLFQAVRDEHLDQIKKLVALKEKWAASTNILDQRRAEKIVALDAVWSELDEIVYPSLPAFRYAKKHGLNTTYHIGESWKEGEFKSALKRLKRVMDYKYIDRIGHGTALGVFVNNLGGIYSHEEITDLKNLQTSLINHPHSAKVVIESCPTSNVYLTEDLMGYQQHVSNFFMDRNFNVILAEDNGRVLHTNGLSAEITRVWMTNPSINFAEIINLIGNSFAHSFTHSANDVQTIRSLREKPSSAISLKNITQHIAEIQSSTVSDSIMLHQDARRITSLTINGNKNIDIPSAIFTEHIKGAYYFFDNHTKENLYLITKDNAFVYDFNTESWKTFANKISTLNTTFAEQSIIKQAA